MKITSTNLDNANTESSFSLIRFTAFSLTFFCVFVLLTSHVACLHSWTVVDQPEL